MKSNLCGQKIWNASDVPNTFYVKFQFFKEQIVALNSFRFFLKISESDVEFSSLVFACLYILFYIRIQVKTYAKLRYHYFTCIYMGKY